MSTTERNNNINEGCGAAVPECREPAADKQLGYDPFNHGYERGFEAGRRQAKDPLVELFTFHSPDELQQHQMAAIREAAKHFAQVVLRCSPRCADQRDAIRKIREACMTANQAVMLKGFNL